MGKLLNLGHDINEISTSKGFESPSPSNIDRKLMLVITELAEAYECVRDDNYALHIINGKPEGFPSEIADAIIRLLHICSGMGIDIDYVIELKMESLVI